MSKLILQYKNILVVVFTCILLTRCSNVDDSMPPDDPCECVISNMEVKTISDKYIVVLKDLPESIKNLSDIKTTSENEKISLYAKEFFEIIPESSIEIAYTSLIYGFLAELTEEQFEIINKDKRVDQIYQDIQFTHKNISNIEHIDYSIKEKDTSWGIVRLNGPYDGTGKRAWVIDTGIDFNHPDLNVNIRESIGFIGNEQGEDDHGHGTQVSGIIGAKNDSTYVVGMASNTQLISVKTIDKDGTGSISLTIKGLEYLNLRIREGDVVNISLGAPASDILDKAIIDLTKKNIYVAVAAGNESSEICCYSPARIVNTRVKIVTGMDEDDVFYRSSNYGFKADYCAPALRILSTTKDGIGYGLGSGTSYASPYIAAMLLIKGDDNFKIDGFPHNAPGRSGSIPLIDEKK